jgi:hypothetical protein
MASKDCPVTSKISSASASEGGRQRLLGVQPEQNAVVLAGQRVVGPGDHGDQVGGQRQRLSESPRAVDVASAGRVAEHRPARGADTVHR